MNTSSIATVLVIDPDALSLNTISSTLRAANYDVEIAQDRKDALKAAEFKMLDLIICDERVDISCGIATIKEIRSHRHCYDTPIMYMSTSQAPDVIHRSHDFGAAYHLRKPIDPAVLLDLVEAALWQLPLINEQVRQQKLRQPHFAIPSVKVNTATDPVAY